MYCLLGNHSGVCLANLHDWDCIALTWPAVVRSGLSSAMSLEKPSIVRLFDDLADKIHRQYETIGISFTVRKTPSTLSQMDHRLKGNCIVYNSFIPSHILRQIISDTTCYIFFYPFRSMVSAVLWPNNL